MIALFVLFLRDGFWAAVRRVAWFGCTSLVIPVLWIARNAASGNPDTLGIRVRSYDTPTSLVNGYLHGAASVLLPRSVTTTPSVCFLLVVAAPRARVGWPVRRHCCGGCTRRPVARSAPGRHVVFAGSSSRARSWPGSTSRRRRAAPDLAGGRDDRRGVSRMDRGVRRAGWHRRRVPVVTALAVVFVVMSVAWFGRQLGPGTPTYYVAGSATGVRLRQAVDAIPRSHLLMSNDPWRIYLETDRQPVELAPIPITPKFSFRPLAVPTVLATACKGPVDLIWFDRGPATGTRSVADLVGRGRSSGWCATSLCPGRRSTSRSRRTGGGVQRRRRAPPSEAGDPVLQAAGEAAGPPADPARPGTRADRSRCATANRRADDVPPQGVLEGSGYRV